MDTPKVRFSVSGPPAELPTPYEVALLRIAQSALGNALRHAHADRVEITLSFMDTSVALDVVDDGAGFTPGGVRPDADRTDRDHAGPDDAVRDHAGRDDTVRDHSGRDRGREVGGASDGGFGLPAMRSRARSLGGTFTVESAPGQGTAVAVTLPLPVTGEPPGKASAGAVGPEPAEPARDAGKPERAEGSRV